jgi:hypothetical protein
VAVENYFLPPREIKFSEKHAFRGHAIQHGAKIHALRGRASRHGEKRNARRDCASLHGIKRNTFFDRVIPRGVIPRANLLHATSRETVTRVI